MKALAIGLLMLGVVVAGGGCATTAYSGGLPTVRFPEERMTGENANRIVRNWAIEQRQIMDDLNNILLLDPPSRLGKWHLR